MLHQLAKKIEREYGLPIDDIQKEEQGSIRLRTVDGRFDLQTARRAQWLLASHAGRYLKSNGFFSFPTVYRTRKGKPYFRSNGRYYGLLTLPTPLRNGANGLAAFHEAGARYECPSGLQNLNRVGRWIRDGEHVLDRFEAFRDEVYEREPKSAWERFVLENFTFLVQLGETALHYARNNGYEEQGFAPPHVVHRSPGEDHLIRPLDWIVDHKFRDVGHTLKSFLLFPQEDPWVRCGSFLDHYATRSPLTFGEYALIYAQLVFPGQCIREIQQADAQNETTRLEVAERWQEEWNRYEQDLGRFPVFLEKTYQVTIPRIEWLTP